ncbi:UNVERIFIED_ORG: chaperonin cofactor prefoldin [Arthrobacter sp. UYCu721]
MVFRKKNRGAEETGGSIAAESEGGGVAVATAPKKRKPQEMLSSVVKESTVGAAVALLRENESFALPSGKSWVVIALPVENIGGLSMKQKNDEAKGSLIELITADEITTVATSDMLDSEIFGIIPSSKSLNRMDEFSLLKNAKYVWVVLTQTPEGALSADPVADATYTEAVAISEGHSSLAQILPDVWTWGGGDGAEAGDTVSAEGTATVAVPVVTASLDEPLTGDAEPFSDDDSPFGADAADDEEPIDYSALADDENGSPEFDSDLGEFEKQFADQADEVDGSDAADTAVAPVAGQEQEYYQDDRVVDEEEVRASIARRFLSSDLDLEIDLETFEVNFNTATPVISFPLEDDATDWLGRQVNQLARQANTELEHLHLNNENALRGLYVSLMSQHIERVIVDVSPDREGSYYNRLMRAAKDDLAGRQKAGPEEVSALRKELNARYEAEAASRGRQAAEQAVLRYKEQNRPRHERELAEVGLTNERASEEFYDGAQQIILDTRRKDALARMDLGKTKILDVLMERQQEHRDAEEALLKGWSAEMMKFIDENRKGDIARSDALAEQLSRDTQIETLKAEHAARVLEMRADQDARVAQLNGDILKVRNEAVTELNAREETWKHNLSLEQQKTTSANSRVKDLLSQFDQLGTSLEGQYTQRIATLEKDKESYSLELDRASKIQSRANKIMVVLIVVLALAALAVGFIVGSVVSGSHAGPAASAATAGVWLGAGDLLPTL